MEKEQDNEFDPEGNAEDMGTIDFEAEREEDKEDEYDYFLDN